jgi:hypothetical protein
LWALSASPIPVAAGDEDTSPVPSVVVMASGAGNGRVVALGHGGFLTNEALGLFDNMRLGNNIIDWADLLGRRKVLVTTGHNEWYGGSNFDEFKNELESRGYIVTRFSGVLTVSALSEVGVVIVGNAWGVVSQPEIDALKSYVEIGGGLLLVGFGWSWEPYNPGSTLDRYPMNLIGLFGIRWMNGAINDSTDSYNGQPVFHTFYPQIELQTIYEAFSQIRTVTDTHSIGLPGLVQEDVSLRRKYA